MKSQRLTLRVTVGGITRVKGEGPHLAWWKRARTPDGKERMISQAVKVQDGDLLQHLKSAVKSGDEIEISIVNEWPEGRGFVSYLAGFSKDGLTYGGLRTLY